MAMTDAIRILLPTGRLLGVAALLMTLAGCVGVPAVVQPTGYGAEGPPSGRYVAPPSDPGCLSLYPGDCAPAQIKLRGPIFSRVDLRLKKRFPFARRAYLELDFEVQNVFDAPNFNHAFDLTPDAPLTSGDVFRVTSAYSDINTTYDPGGRLGQIVWRVSW